jgi:hypothetical protein
MYYTLSGNGRRWFAGKERAPRSNLKVLSALAGLVQENDIPRTTEQIAHATNLTPKAVETALTTLIKDGFVAQAKPPQPIEKTMTPKLRVRTGEEEAARIIKEQESRRRYDHSEKGQFAHYKFEHSDKGIIKNQRYWRDRGLLIQKVWRIRKNIRTMTEHGIDRALIAEEEAKLKEAEAELKREE